MSYLSGGRFMASVAATFKIETGVPMSARTGPRSKGYSDALRSLKVGQSVVLPTSAESIHALCRRIEGKFSVACVGGLGYRVWRRE